MNSRSCCSNVCEPHVRSVDTEPQQSSASHALHTHGTPTAVLDLHRDCSDRPLSHSHNQKNRNARTFCVTNEHLPRTTYDIKRWPPCHLRTARENDIPWIPPNTTTEPTITCTACTHNCTVTAMCIRMHPSVCNLGTKHDIRQSEGALSSSQFWSLPTVWESCVTFRHSAHWLTSFGHGWLCARTLLQTQVALMP